MKEIFHSFIHLTNIYSTVLSPDDTKLSTFIELRFLLERHGKQDKYINDMVC